VLRLSSVRKECARAADDTVMSTFRKPSAVVTAQLRPVLPVTITSFSDVVGSINARSSAILVGQRQQQRRARSSWTAMGLSCGCHPRRKNGDTKSNGGTVTNEKSCETHGCSRSRISGEVLVNQFCLSMKSREGMRP
jgi:hypothetical protein